MSSADVKKIEMFVQERSTALQILLGLVVYLTSIAPSMSIGFSAVALPPLLDEHNPHKLTANQASWFASIASIATPVGCFISGPLSDKFGRRSALLTINVITFLGWIIIALAYDLKDNQYITLLIGRLVTGLSTGLASMPAAVYMAEVSSPNLRGMFTTASGIFFSLGVLLVYILGSIFKNDWGTVATITAIIPCTGMVASLCYLPESPSWLISKNNVHQASKNMTKIYGFKEYNVTIQEDIQALIKNRDASKIVSNEQKTISTILKKKFNYFKKPTCYKPFALVLTYFFFQQFSGTFVIIFYAIDIVQRAGVSIEPYLAICLIALTRFVAAILMSYVSRNYGRRPTSIVSGIGMTICMIILGCYLYLQEIGTIHIGEHNWLPTALLVIYFFTSTLGFLTIPFAMAAECFPAKIRGLASGLITCIGYIFNFIVVKIYPDMINTMNAHGVFFFYGLMCLAGTIFIVVWLPETKGRTLSEIEEYFGNKKINQKAPT